MKIRPNYVNPLTMMAEKTAQYQPAAQKNGETDKVAELQTKRQQLQNKMLLLQATGTDSAGATAETRKVVEAELEKVTAELQSVKGSSVQAVEHVSVELEVTKPRMDEYVPEEKAEPSGRYFLGKDVDGKPKIYFDDPTQAENTPKKPADLPDKSGKSCTVNTDKVDREIENLKMQKRELEQQINRETDVTKVKNLKAKLTQIERELNKKDNDTYRRQHATYTFS